VWWERHSNLNSGSFGASGRTFSASSRPAAITAGISAYILYRAESADVIRQFADEVVPAVRDAVTAERARHI
jgi:hypothetical protein